MYKLLKMACAVFAFSTQANAAPRWLVQPSTGARTTAELSGQMLIYASTSSTNSSIILQGNGGRATFEQGVTASSFTATGTGYKMPDGTILASTAPILSTATAEATYVKKIGDTMTGPLTTTSMTVTGGVTVDSPTFTIDAVNNRVGILRTNPSVTLDVGGQIYSRGNLFVDTIGPLTGDPLKLNTKLSVYSTTGVYIGTSTATAPTQLLEVAGGVIIRDSMTVGTASNTLVVNSVNHRVGIATGTPATELEVTGTATLGRNTNALVYPLLVKNYSTSGSAEVAMQFVTGGGAPYIGATRYQSTVGNDGLFIRDTAGLEVARFTRGGNVGVGTTAPSVKLEVVGAVKVSSGMTVDTTSNTLVVDAINHRVGIGTASPVDIFHALSPLTAAWFESTTSGGATIKLKNTEGEARINADNNALDFRAAASGSAQMTLINSGNFGIATASPQYKLHVDGGGYVSSSFTVVSTVVAGAFQGPATVEGNVAYFHADGTMYSATPASGTVLLTATQTFSGVNTFSQPGGIVLSTYSATENGFTYLPGGILLQWGYYTGGANNPTITFPKAFNTLFSLSVTPQGNDASINGEMADITSSSTTNFSAEINRHDAAEMTSNFRWIAIGN